MTRAARVGLLAPLCAAAAGAPWDAAGQAASAPVVFSGQVIDTYAAAPVPGAVVRLTETLRRDGSAIVGLTDEEGRFSIAGVPPGPSHVLVSRFGYVDLAQVLDIQAGQTIEVAVVPKPVLLEGIVVYVDRLADRLAELPYAASAFLEETIKLAPDLDVASFLASQPGLDFVPCFESGANMGAFTRMPECIRTRGSVVQRPRIYVDDAPAFGGVRELATMPTTEIYRIEVIRGCAQIRVYTLPYVENAAARPRALIPIVC